MEDTAKGIVDGLFEAIRAEQDGYHFYMMAARNTQDEQGRRIFEQLAGEELNHRQVLEQQYNTVLRTGRADPDLKLGPRAELSGDSPIFSNGLKERIADAHYEMSALSIGVQLEQNAINAYQQLADDASDPTIKAFFEELVQWERGHHNALLQQQETLKEAYWSASGFARW